MKSTPLRPSTAPSQVDATSFPSGVTAPRPVMTTLRTFSHYFDGRAGSPVSSSLEGFERAESSAVFKRPVSGAGSRQRPEARHSCELAARAPARYFLAASKYGLVPVAWSVTSTTRVISGTIPVMATSIPCVRVTGAMAQP